MLQNHYELLGINYDADLSEIRSAYEEKIMSANELMSEKYKTAYYHLSDERRRQKYDRDIIGIHKYKKVSFVKKFLKIFLRFILTILDVLCTFYWCLLVAIAISLLFYTAYNFYNTGAFYPEQIDLMKYRSPCILALSIAVLDLLIHFPIRRANRFLKHYQWELK